MENTLDNLAAWLHDRENFRRKIVIDGLEFMITSAQITQEVPGYISADLELRWLPPHTPLPVDPLRGLFDSLEDELDEPDEDDLDEDDLDYADDRYWE